ncbi:MAG: DUF2085 domain-containing protein [Candidatus Lokiarchaeota archaeon]|nr:DUF2085 domain-containing protein [Candidatus Lokiarchaeota archaeon]
MELKDGQTAKKEARDLYRLIFLNLLISFFIIMVYFYLSEMFGSISAFFRDNPQFSINIVISTIGFAFLAILAGGIHGFISGFFGELLVQRAFYGTIDFSWCVIVAVLGLICGLYRYKPERKNKLKALFYTFLCLFFAILITTIALITFTALSTSTLINPYSLLINFGFKYFLTLLVSIMIFVPLLLVAYDWGFSNKERNIIHEFLTHHANNEEGLKHAFYFQFGRTRIFLCSRCSGVILGIIFSSFVFHFIDMIYQFEISPEFAIIFCSLAPIPVFLDWGSQKMLLRTSNTKYRLLTGVILGFSMYAITFTRKYFLILLLVVMIYFVILFVLFFFGQKKAFRIYNQEFEEGLLKDTDSEDDTHEKVQRLFQP